MVEMDTSPLFVKAPLAIEKRFGVVSHNDAPLLIVREPKLKAKSAFSATLCATITSVPGSGMQVQSQVKGLRRFPSVIDVMVWPNAAL
jgi:hypothetical protein